MSLFELHEIAEFIQSHGFKAVVRDGFVEAWEHPSHDGEAIASVEQCMYWLGY